MSNSNRAKERRSKRSRLTKGKRKAVTGARVRGEINRLNNELRARRDSLMQATPGEFMRQIGLGK